ncbi:hypothetical protein RvY_03932-2 [Ramazzottius varieornatus]|uniref:Major facilitator superfamily (MFS) profile domain-containing protein n=1 Tax=Ramazzottius varieornatus TaxID=947166 RepID=A0A1D1UZW1_RAMVA|nr:hypothetical protein RvY_03932-2 [Ramazzottius varieornatus]
MAVEDDEECIHPKGAAICQDETSELGLLKFQSEKDLCDGNKLDVVQFDDVLIAVHPFGPYQKLIVFGVLLPCMLAYAFSNGFWLFVIATPEKFWCRNPDNEGGTLNSTPYGFSQAARNVSEQCFEPLDTNQRDVIIRCRRGWDFDQSVYESTIVTEWQLVCSSYDFYPTLLYIITYIVGTLGLPIGGYFSDQYGRKKTYFVFLALEILSGIALAFSTSYWPFVFIACLHSVGCNPTYQAIYTLGQEILCPEHRTTYTALIGFFYAIGSCVCAICAYYVRHWRKLILTCTLPLTGFLAISLLMPESPRFNLSKKRYKEVERFFRTAAKWNKVDYNLHCEDKLEELIQQDKKASTERSPEELEDRKYSFRDIFQHPVLRRRTIVLMTLSATVAVCYGGLGYYAPQFGANPHLNVFLTSVVDLPASLLTQLIADRFGRRLTIATNFILGGATCLITLAFHPADQYYYAILVLFLLARMFAVSSYSVEELISCENYPTVVRGEGFSLTNGVSGLVASLGPLIVYLNVGEGSQMPLVWFGAITIVGSMVVLFFPETAHQPLLETLDDVQDFVMVRSFKEFLVPLWQKPLKLETVSQRTANTCDSSTV